MPLHVCPKRIIGSVNLCFWALFIILDLLTFVNYILSFSYCFLMTTFFHSFWEFIAFFCSSRCFCNRISFKNFYILVQRVFNFRCSFTYCFGILLVWFVLTLQFLFSCCLFPFSIFFTCYFYRFCFFNSCSISHRDAISRRFSFSNFFIIWIFKLWRSGGHFVSF